MLFGLLKASLIIKAIEKTPNPMSIIAPMITLADTTNTSMPPATEIAAMANSK